MKAKGGKGFGHEAPYEGNKNEWFTPKYIIDALHCKFVTDPCTSKERPFNIGIFNWTPEEDGLKQLWMGKVFLNPPYGPHAKVWLEKLSEHGNGIALTFARTGTKMFWTYVWGKADAILFLKGRIKFCDSKGIPQGAAGSPSCLIAYGDTNAKILKNCDLEGVYISKWEFTRENLL